MTLIGISALTFPQFGKDVPVGGATLDDSLERHKTDPQSVSVKFYFKDAEISPELEGLDAGGLT